MNKIFLLLTMTVVILSGCDIVSTDKSDTITVAQNIIEDQVYLVQFHNGNYGLGVQRSVDNNNYIPYSLPYINEGSDFMGRNVGGAAVPNTTLDEFADIIGPINIPYPKDEAYPTQQNRFNLIDQGGDSIYIVLRQKSEEDFSTIIKRYNLRDSTIDTLVDTGVLLYLYDIQGNYLLTHLGQRDNESNLRPPYDVVLIDTTINKRYNLGPVMDVVINSRNPEADAVSYTRIFTKNESEICQDNIHCTIGRDTVMYYDMLRTTDRLTDNLLY